MSHSQFHCTGRVYLDLHGLIFETSICYWQDQPGSHSQLRCLYLGTRSKQHQGPILSRQGRRPWRYPPSTQREALNCPWPEPQVPGRRSRGLLSSWSAYSERHQLGKRNHNLGQTAWVNRVGPRLKTGFENTCFWRRCVTG